MHLKKFFAICLSIFLIVSCKKDENEPTTGGSGGTNNNENEMALGTFTAEVTGDFEHSLSGMAWFEMDGGDQVISFWVTESDWVSFAFQFNPSIEVMKYTAREVDPSQNREDNEVDATTSNGDYFFFGTDGEMDITKATENQINGDFDVNYEYSDNDNTYNINIKGSFSAEKD
jgi:hypothetical protein